MKYALIAAAGCLALAAPANAESQNRNYMPPPREIGIVILASLIASLIISGVFHEHIGQLGLTDQRVGQLFDTICNAIYEVR